VSTRRHPNHRSRSELPRELHRVGVPPAAREWIRSTTGSPVVGARRLPGASSSAVHEVRLASGEVAVLRRYAWAQMLVEEPEAPVREIAALEFARRHGLPVPAVLAADPSGHVIGDGVPALLMTRVPGHARAAPDVRKLAEVAASIHATSAVGFGHRFFPWCRATSTAPPKHCRRPDVWQRALDLWRTGEPAYEPCFVHRDFHPGNVLWSRGRATGVVDWVAACAGPAGIDVAACRWNLDDWAGAGTGAAFVHAYEAVTGRPHDPYWDLAWVLEDDWDLIDDAARVRHAERRLAATLR